MALEDKLDALIVALNRNSDLLEAGGGGKAGGAASTGGKAGGKADKPKNTVEQMKAAVMNVKEKKGGDAAKAIIEAQVGKTGAKLADLANLPAKFDSTVAACEAALDDGDEGGEDEI